MRLIELFETEGTDKAQYAASYEVLLRARREQIHNVLEIGIGTLQPDAPASMHEHGASNYRPGGSLRAWRDYFPHAQIVGLDIQPDTQFDDTRISTFICDSTDAAASKKLLETVGPFDLIIDDGSHAPDDQLTSLSNFFPAVAAGGLYAIEDVGWKSELFKSPHLIEPLIDGAPYCAVYGVDPTWGPWKLIVIARPA